MKALLHFRSLLQMAVVLAVAFSVTSCASKDGKPRRDEPSPFAPQWQPLRHNR